MTTWKRVNSEWLQLTGVLDLARLRDEEAGSKETDAWMRERGWDLWTRTPGRDETAEMIVMHKDGEYAAFFESADGEGSDVLMFSTFPEMIAGVSGIGTLLSLHGLLTRADDAEETGKEAEALVFGRRGSH